MADLGSEVLVLPEQAGESSSSSAKRHEQDLPYWSSAMKDVLLVQPSSAASERVITKLFQGSTV